MLHHAADKRVHLDGFVLHPVGAVGAVMVGDPLAIIAINAPDGDRRAHHLLGYIARQALVLRGDSPLLHVRHQAVGVLPEKRIDQPLNRIGLEGLAQHRQQGPPPLPHQQVIGQILEFIPLSFWYDAPLIARDSDRRHDPWLVYGSPSYSPVRWSSWILRA